MGSPSRLCSGTRAYVPGETGVFALEAVRPLAAEKEAVLGPVRATQPDTPDGAGEPVAPPNRAIGKTARRRAERRVAGAHDACASAELHLHPHTPVDAAASRLGRQGPNAASDVTAQVGRRPR